MVMLCATGALAAPPSGAPSGAPSGGPSGTPSGGPAQGTPSPGRVPTGGSRQAGGSPPAPNLPVTNAPAGDMPSPDNPAFCAHLLDMVRVYRSKRADEPPEVAGLTARGADLCAVGKMRSGIWHLRHALRELREEPEAAPE